VIRRLRRRRGLFRLPFVFAALAVVPSAYAGVRVQSVDTSCFPVVRATIVAPIGAATPVVTEDGRGVVGYQAVNLGREKAIVLALDRSQSMLGRPFRVATAAAQTFVGATHGADHVGVVAFGRSAIPVIRLGSSPGEARDALAGLAVDQKSGTALYDAIVLAASRLQGDSRHGRAIVVVTDGKDVSSRHSLEDAITAAHEAHAAVYTIGIGGPSFTPDALRRLAAQTGGSYRQANRVDGLGAVYASLAEELARTWQVSYATAGRPGARLHLHVAVPHLGAASTTVELGGGGSSGDGPSGVIPAGAYSSAGTLAVGLAAGFLVLLACCFWFASQRGDKLRARIQPHLSQVTRDPKARRRNTSDAARTQISNTVERAFGELRQFKRLQVTIERADIPLRAGELVAMSAGAAFVCGLVAAVAAGSSLVILAVMGVAGAVPIAYVSFKASRRIAQFENQLPDLLITIAASLKAGHSFRQAIQSVVDEGMEPAAKEFRRVLTETQLGKPMDDALVALGERVGSKNLTFVINAVTIQRQIGGALAGLFDMVADTVRQRQQFMRKVKGLTAMGRMTAYVLTGLPFGIGLLITVMNPTYMSPLFNTHTGQMVLASGAVMLLIGTGILRKMVQFKG
jgi:tight adherence protein B